MALITVNLRLVRPQGTNDTPDPAMGRVDFIPVAHGKYHNSLRTIEKVTSQIDAEGEMKPVELTPDLWKVTITPSKGNPWPEMLFELTEGMPEPVNLADLLPQTVVNGVQLAKGDPGPSIVSWEDNEDGTIKFLLSDGSYTDSGTMPHGPQGPVGDQGPIGPKGSQGAEGPKGDQGVQGPVGPAGMTWRGVWSPEDDYINDDSVYHEGSSWFAAGDPAPGEEPSTDSAHWHALAMQGAQGIQGSQGIQGPEGPQGPVGLTGPAPELVWDGTSLVIDGGEPVDLKGEKGDGSSWSELTGKPASFPSTVGDVDGLQAIIDRLTVGTGWRDIRPLGDGLNGPEVTIGRSDINRIGPLVTLRGWAQTTGDLLSVILFQQSSVPGFKMGGNYDIPGGTAGSGVAYISTLATSAEMRVRPGTGSTGNILRFHATWLTEDPWPTTLPGTPA